MKAYKLSKLSNGYKTKINPSFPPLETWPIGTTRVRRGVAAHVSIYGEPAGNYPEEIQSHDDGEQTDLPKIRGHHKRRERTVMKLLPVDRKDTQTYQVHELSDEEPNQESHVQSKPSISPVHKTTTSQNRHSQHVGPATADEERPSPGKESSGLWPEHNGNAEDAITVFGHTPALVQAEQNYRELERNGDGMRSRSDVDTDLSHGQGQETSRHDPRTGSDIHGQRLNHHLEQSNGNKEEPIQANTQSDLESETNASRRPNEQMGGRREPVTDYYEYENTGPGLTYDEEDGPEHRKHTTASDGRKEMPFRSMSLSDIPSSSPRSDPSLAGTPDSAELHVEAKAGNEGRRSNKDESAGYDEEPVMNREQNDDGSESYEPFQLKYVTLGHNSQNTEYPIYETENEDSMETRGETEEEVKKEEEKEEKEKEKEKKEKEKREKEKREKEEAEEAEGGIYAALSKILEKKDAISRDEDIVGREEGENTNKKQADSYHNYWVLEYSRPKFSK
ncbi:hypothetical protein B7P43_G07571 [Cryptotermes secundus]|uniref:Uncharacterized protein n=1 Tax=Cryptotermes secundus TaxID=105785 RepID=A0A2J7QI42_9NEOP|nr:hypothetical protein B7P43_G07571 [Cryptotermes secundus]